MNDLELHRLIWTQVDNQYLLKALNTLVGSIFMFMAQNARNWDQDTEMHEELVTYINSGDVLMAVKSVEHNMDVGLHTVLNVFQASSNKLEGSS